MGCYILSERYDQEFSTLLVCWARSFLSEVKCYLAELHLNIYFDPRGLPKFSPPTKKFSLPPKILSEALEKSIWPCLQRTEELHILVESWTARNIFIWKETNSNWRWKFWTSAIRFCHFQIWKFKVTTHTDDVFQLKTFQMHQPEKVFKLEFFIFPWTIEEILRRCSNCVLPKKEKCPLPFQFQRGKSIFWQIWWQIFIFPWTIGDDYICFYNCVNCSNCPHEIMNWLHFFASEYCFLLLPHLHTG